MSMSFDIITNVLVTTHTYRISSIEAGSPVLELPGGGGLGGLAPLVQALPQTPIIGLRSALAIRPLKTF